MYIALDEDATVSDCELCGEEVILVMSFAFRGGLVVRDLVVVCTSRLSSFDYICINEASEFWKVGRPTSELIER